LVECEFRSKGDAPAQLYVAATDGRAVEDRIASEGLARTAAGETKIAVITRRNGTEARVIEGIGRVAAELEFDLLPD
jgi:hypothetical protein